MDVHELHTRALPRALEYCNVSTNRLFGTVGLRTLPEHLVHLNLSMNRLVGPVDLTELPRKLRSLDLWDNRIRQSVVFFGHLPPNLKYVKFHFVAGNNRITKLRGTSTENVERLGEIFPDMPRKHIHIE
ncbi:leucine-rich repeat [Perkinsela sp. CCAP 1560/4]|nr:leucine-rich repeat [Perkinsela sp. CCAP 1560/4]|eukprot:KNH02034.1 leucine-rich repeat [Perkinsela sp. CCAP 1560/4]